MYSALIEEYKALRGKLSQLSGTKHESAMMRLIEIDNELKKMETNLHTRHVGNYKTAISNNIMQELEVHAICTDLIIKSWWASWLPFGWMHSLAASYYARKARRIFNSRSTSIPE